MFCRENTCGNFADWMEIVNVYGVEVKLFLCEKHKQIYEINKIKEDEVKKAATEEIIPKLDICSGCCAVSDIVVVNPSGSFCQECVDDKLHLD